MEQEFINWLRSRVDPVPQPQVGIGDDAAVLIPSSSAPLVVTTDMLMEGVDFEFPAASAEEVGHKALAVNLSDLAAMAAEPVAAFVSLALPERGGRRLAERIYDGILPLAREYGVALAGGDTNSWDSPLVISITAVGSTLPEGPLLRSGARSGQAILVTGALGGSILGRHIHVTPRVREAQRLRSEYRATAAIDISDGFALDLSRVCRESGCGAEVELSQIPIHEDAISLAGKRRDGLTPLDHALADGEDFELILAMDEDDARRLVAAQPLGIRITRVGRFTSGDQMCALSRDGQRQPLRPVGYEHSLD